MAVQQRQRSWERLTVYRALCELEAAAHCREGFTFPPGNTVSRTRPAGRSRWDKRDRFFPGCGAKEISDRRLPAGLDPQGRTRGWVSRMIWRGYGEIH